MLLLKNKRRLLLGIFIATAFLGLFSSHKLRAPKRKYSDFHCFYLAGKRALNQENIYVLRDKEAAEFRYAPIFAVIMSGFALFNEGTADSIWFILNFSLLIISLLCIKKLVIPGRLGYKKGLFIYALTIAGVMRFILHNFDTGQSNILMISSMLIGLYYISKNRSVLGSAIFAFSVMIKYTPLIFIPYFIFKRRFKLALATIIFILIYLALPSLILGFKTNLQYLKSLVPFLTQSTIFDQMTILDPKNQSLLSFFHRIFTNCILYFHAPVMPFQSLNLKGAYINLIFVLFAALMYSLILYDRKKNYSNNPKSLYNIDYALLFICVALFNLNAWVHNFILLSMAYFMLIYYLTIVKFKDSFTSILLFFSYLLNILTIKSAMGKTLAYQLHFYSPFTVQALIAFFLLLRIKFSGTKRLIL
ncbi:MAG: glycosyltransferase family 87 protein [Candidatus Omnitrophica bacterium]|nr:glycosyltransferase family 87 protein [Candidatus Omnitrophota bacterium]